MMAWHIHGLGLPTSSYSCWVSLKELISNYSFSNHHRTHHMHHRYKGVILLEAFMFAFCVVLMPDDTTKLIASTAVTACFTLVACCTRPYISDFEAYMDIAGRVFLLATLGVGMGLNEDMGRADQAVCDVVLAVVVLASNAMFLIVLNPLKLLYGWRKAANDTLHAAKVMRWDEATIEKLSPEDLKAITQEDVALCSSLQLLALMKYHGGSESQLPAGIFDQVTELNFEDVDLSHTGASSLQEMLSVLAPFASSLEVIDLRGKELGGAITSAIGVFAKLKKLDVSGMKLEGTRAREPSRMHLFL